MMHQQETFFIACESVLEKNLCAAVEANLLQFLAGSLLMSFFISFSLNKRKMSKKVPSEAIPE